MSFRFLLLCFSIFSGGHSVLAFDRASSPFARELRELPSFKENNILCIDIRISQKPRGFFWEPELSRDHGYCFDNDVRLPIFRDDEWVLVGGDLIGFFLGRSKGEWYAGMPCEATFMRAILLPSIEVELGVYLIVIPSRFTVGGANPRLEEEQRYVDWVYEKLRVRDERLRVGVAPASDVSYDAFAAFASFLQSRGVGGVSAHDSLSSFIAAMRAILFPHLQGVVGLSCTAAGRPLQFAQPLCSAIFGESDSEDEEDDSEEESVDSPSGVTCLPGSLLGDGGPGLPLPAAASAASVRGSSKRARAW